MTLCALTFSNTSFIEEASKIPATESSKINTFKFCEDTPSAATPPSTYSNKVYCRKFAVSLTTTLCFSRTQRPFTPQRR